MTRFILKGLFYVLLLLAIHSAYLRSIEGYNEYTRTVQGQACVDTAEARGWIKPDRGKK